MGLDETGSSPIVGDRTALGGLAEGVPVDIISRTHTNGLFVDFDNPYHVGATGWTLGVAATVTQGSGNAFENKTYGSARFQTANATDTTTGRAFWAGTDAHPPLFRARETRAISFGARVAVPDWDLNHWFFGFGEAGNTALDTDGTLDTGTTGMVGFYHTSVSHTDGSGNSVTAGRLYGVSVTAASSTLSDLGPVSDFTDGDYYTLGFRIVGLNSVQFYRQQDLRVAPLGYLQRATTVAAVGDPVVPDGGLSITGDKTILLSATNEGANQAEIRLDYFWASQNREGL